MQSKSSQYQPRSDFYYWRRNQWARAQNALTWFLDLFRNLHKNTKRMHGYQRVRLVVAGAVVAFVSLVAILSLALTTAGLVATTSSSASNDTSMLRDGCYMTLQVGLRIDDRCVRYDFADQNVSYTFLDLDNDGTMDVIKIVTGGNVEHYYYAKGTPFAAFLEASTYRDFPAEVLPRSDGTWKHLMEFFDARRKVAQR